MGHTRLGTIPKSRKWSAVVAAIGGEDGAGGAVTTALAEDVEHIAARTLEAAETGLARAIDDPGLGYTFYLLSQLVLAAREPDWQGRLAVLGIQLEPSATPFDLTVEVQGAIDDHLLRRGQTTDISEMAQRAAGEALSTLVGPRATTLFGSGADELRVALRQLSTRTGFAEIGQRFFGGFMARFLNFYLSRITAADVGGRRLEGLGDVSHFNASLERHCYESARIVRDFCGDWYSGTEFREGITLANTSGFMAVAIRKLQAELAQQRQEGA